MAPMFALSSAFFLLLLVFPSILMESVAAQIYEEASQGVTLPCDYSFSGGNVRYTIDWHKGSLRLLNWFSTDASPVFDNTDLSGRLSLQDWKNLVISNLRRTDDGRYYCSVSEVGGNPPGVGSDQNLVVTVSPSVTLSPSGQTTATTGRDVTLTCNVDSKPEANITWTGPNGDLGTENRVVLNNVQPANDTGTYTCTATNSFSATKSASGSVMLTVQGPSTSPTTTAMQTEGPNVTLVSQTEANCSGPGVVAGAAVGCFIGGFLVGSAAVFLFLHFRTAKNGGKKDARNLADGQYENVPHPNKRMASQRPGSGSDEYEVPMETIQPPTVQPPQPSDDYQELRPAVYQSLQRH